MTSDQPVALSSYMMRLLSTGRVVFSREEAQQALGVTQGALLDSAERQQRKQLLISPRRGFYVIVPPQFLAWGAPPPSWYIDDLMRHEGCPYYTGLLKAAYLHGATHQAVMEFQVVTNKRLPEIRAGRSRITFYYRKDMAAVGGGIEEFKTDAGAMKISSVELTLLDLVRYPQAGCGLDTIATVIADIGDRINARRLTALSSAFERTIIQRLGYLLERLGYADHAQKLHKAILRKATLPWVELERSRLLGTNLLPAPIERNEHWHVIVRRLPELDE